MKKIAKVAKNCICKNCSLIGTSKEDAKIPFFFSFYEGGTIYKCQDQATQLQLWRVRGLQRTFSVEVYQGNWNPHQHDGFITVIPDNEKQAWVRRKIH